MTTTDQLQVFGGRKNLKNYFGQFFFNFNITFLATCGCASDFLKMLPEFKMATWSQLHNSTNSKSTQKLNVRIIQILQSHIPHNM